MFERKSIRGGISADTTSREHFRYVGEHFYIKGDGQVWTKGGRFSRRISMKIKQTKYVLNDLSFAQQILIDEEQLKVYAAGIDERRMA